MPSLSRELRRELERTVKQARKVAEDGATKAIDRLGVGHAQPPKGITADEQALRRRLRAHGRQLGDGPLAKGAQATTRLISECAYEHWHRLLFARFLAENELLIEPEHQLSITLEDCRELAREQGLDWLELASSYATRMLPQIFRQGDPVLEVQLPPENRSQLEDLLKALPRETFLADDSLGWVYQFWQADRKEEVNASETKIGADELPAVTQLFTEDYMVLFLLHNTLGAWWAGKVLAARPELASTAESEAELRSACAVGDVEWTYLRFVRADEGPWRPAAGTFDGWPTTAREITVLDPCMGSGHFLVFGLPILVALRMEEEGLSRRDAVDAVLRDNLHGLEIDPRCTQIAAFNLALAAWKLVGYHELPELHLACSGLTPAASEEEWLKLAEKSGLKMTALSREPILNGLRNLHALFSEAPTLGSLIDPNQLSADLITADYETLEPYLAAALKAEHGDHEVHERAVAAAGMVKATELLAAEHTLVVTNVPYLGRSKQIESLRDYLTQNFEEGQGDLATAFLMRCLQLTQRKATAAIVCPHNWLFSNRTKPLREMGLTRFQWDMVARLGPGAFETISGHVVNVALIVLTSSRPFESSTLVGIDVSQSEDSRGKAESLTSAKITEGNQLKMLLNPGASIMIGNDSADVPLLDDYCTSLAGATAGDKSRFSACWWEIPSASIGVDWELYQSAPVNRTLYGGRELAVLWQSENGEMAALADSVKHLNHVAQNWLRGKPNWNKRGVVVGIMSELPFSLYEGEIYDCNCCAVVPNDQTILPALLCYFQSGEYCKAIRDLNQALAVSSTSTFTKVPFDLEYWQQIVAQRFPNGIPEPESDDASQWLFHGRPEQSTSPLQVSVARLLGYRWPAELDGDMRLSQRARELVKRCDGLLPHADADGIVCLTPIKGEALAADRLTRLLADAYGSEWSAGKLDSLLRDVGYAGKSLDDWLRDGFFENHCDVFHNRPFIWHIWDGRRDGFHALVNYHRLAAPNGEGRRTLEKLIYSYLGDWIERQEREQKEGLDGADARLAAAKHLRTELENILTGEPPYDLFVRWKPLHQQPIGWEPDINDGVRLNIRPFMTARPLGARARNACILRATPKNIKWTKDRGKEPQREKADFPWFWSWDEATQDFKGGAAFDGNRWNDLHYSNAVKQAARERVAVKTPPSSERKSK
ncbi:Eco57I restriction-modification methylase domain-containing protein [Planctomicrobium sp. SH661]|uniref:Eco57I restriction-modification methylase domain-containing protein n=1 Tax=Planctomicrobium sp. SH661 TaxID=3448124 RepID=UPI003F5CAA0A